MTATPPVRPSAVSHLVFNVRDLEASHRFYTDVLGFELVGEMFPTPNHNIHMRFYGCDDGYHHRLALAQTVEECPPARPWRMSNTFVGVNHLAVAYGDRGTWLRQLAHVRSLGVEVVTRLNHGMTHSAYVQDPDGNGIEMLYDLPEEVWSGDRNAALNHFERLPTSGDEMLEDVTDYPVFG